MSHKLLTGASVLAVVIFLGALAYALSTPLAAPPPSAVAPPPAPAPADTPPADTAKSDPADTAPAKPAPPAPRDEAPRIAPATVDGADIAAYYNLKIHKFEFTVPESEYTLYVWTERWTRDAEKPQLALLRQATGVFAAGDVVVKPSLPGADDGYVRIRIAGVAGHFEARPTDPLAIPSPYRTDSLTAPAPLIPGQDVHLIAYKHNATGLSSDGLAGVEDDNDVTIYVKLRLAKGPAVPLHQLLGDDHADQADHRPAGLTADNPEAAPATPDPPGAPAADAADVDRYRFKPRNGD